MFEFDLSNYEDCNLRFDEIVLNLYKVAHEHLEELEGHLEEDEDMKYDNYLLKDMKEDDMTYLDDGQLLNKACLLNREDIARAIIKTCLNVNYRDNGIPTINYVIYNDNMNMLDILLERKEDLDVYFEEDKYCFNPIHITVINRNLPMLKNLLSNFNINKLKDKNKYNLFHHACEFGYKEIVDYFLDEDIFKLDSKTEFGKTCFHMLGYNSNLEMLLYLKSKIKDINSLHIFEEDNIGNNLLHIGIISNNILIQKFFINLYKEKGIYNKYVDMC
jgi:ankyrin repeat protein